MTCRVIAANRTLAQHAGMRIVVAIAFLAVGLVNLLPVAGASSDAMLTRLYGVAIDEPDLSVLMRHRAVLFGVVGGLLVAAAFVPSWRGVAAAAALISMVSFTALAWLTPGSSPAIDRIATIDVVASAVLLLALALDRWLEDTAAA